MNPTVTRHKVVFTDTRSEYLRIGDGMGLTPVSKEYEGEVELTIDIEALLWRVGRDALRSKLGKAQIAHGVIKAKVVSGGLKGGAN